MSQYSEYIELKVVDSIKMNEYSITFSDRKIITKGEIF
jgi:hypothetical protein